MFSFLFILFGCLPQILLGRLLNTLTHLFLDSVYYFFRESSAICVIMSLKIFTIFRIMNHLTDLNIKNVRGS